MDYFLDAMKKYADFSGRATRKDYWMFVLIYFILYIACAIIDAVITMPIFTLVFSLGTLIPCISVAARRLHDTTRSGWWQLISFIPLIGAIVLIIFLVQDSHDDNQYGANPKAAIAG